MAGNDRFKMPQPWETSRPKFDGTPSGTLTRFVEQVDAIILGGAITDEQLRKEKLLSYIDDKRVRDAWKSLPEFTAPQTYARWKKSILALYPEIEEIEKGSLSALKEICEEAKGLTRADYGKLKRFSVFFRVEADKLLVTPAVVTNLGLVNTILTVLSAGFAKQVEDTMNLPGALQTIIPVAEPVPDEEEGAAGRRGDKLSYKDVLKIAMHLAETWTGREALFEISGGRSDERSLVGVVAPKTGSPVPYAIKREFNEQFESLSLEIAAIKDTFNVRDKQLAETLKKFDYAVEMAKSLKQEVAKAPAANGEQSNDYRPQARDQFQPREPNNYRMTPPTHLAVTDLKCHWCGKPNHMVRDCPEKRRKLDEGVIVMENGQLRMADGSYISRYPESMTKDERVNESLRKQGKPGVSALLYQESFYNMQQDEQANQVWDTTADELRSMRVKKQQLEMQLQQLQNGGTSGMGSSMGIGYAQPRESPPHLNLHQGIQYAQSPMGYPPTAVSPAGPAMSMEQLLVLLNRGMNSQSTQNQPAEQYLLTRGGARSDPPPQQGF